MTKDELQARVRQEAEDARKRLQNAEDISDRMYLLGRAHGFELVDDLLHYLED